MSQDKTWFIILYEWQACQTMSNDDQWYQSARIFKTEESAQFELEVRRKGEQPRAGRITHRNVRGPFTWAEP